LDNKFRGMVADNNFVISFFNFNLNKINKQGLNYKKILK
jgi:hypothetical protein